MDDNTKDSKKNPPYASSNYSSLEFGAHVALLQERWGIVTFYRTYFYYLRMNLVGIWTPSKILSQ
jgi:hypothetical protein